MAAFIDPVTFLIRAGPNANRYGDPWRSCCSLTIQYDRMAYMYGIGSTELKSSDALDGIREVKKWAGVFGWRGIIWTRERDGKTHKVIVPLKESSKVAENTLEPMSF